MHKIKVTLALAGVVLLAAQPLMAAAGDCDARMRLADSLVAKRQDPASLKKALALYLELAAEKPQDYEANWKVAKAGILCGEYYKFAMAPDYPQMAIENGKRGLEYAGRALAINPEGIDAIMFYALSAGAYAEGASILTALKEGLNVKFEKNLLKVYECDKAYWDYYAVLALGELYYLLPWPMRDNKKALLYLEELQGLNPDLEEGRLFLARALLNTAKAADRERAEDLLVGLADSKVKLFRTESRAILKEEFGKSVN